MQASTKKMIGKIGKMNLVDFAAWVGFVCGFIAGAIACYLAVSFF